MEDPAELKDLADDSAHRAVRDRLHKRLREWMGETNDQAIDTLPKMLGVLAQCESNDFLLNRLSNLIDEFLEPLSQCLTPRLFISASACFSLPLPA